MGFLWDFGLISVPYNEKKCKTCSDSSYKDALLNIVGGGEKVMEAKAKEEEVRLG